MGKRKKPLPPLSLLLTAGGQGVARQGLKLAGECRAERRVEAREGMRVRRRFLRLQRRELLPCRGLLLLLPHGVGRAG